MIRLTPVKTVAIFGLALLLYLAAIASCSPPERPTTSELAVERDQPKWAALFDIKLYAERFGKRYKSGIELAVRHFNLMTSALKVYVAAIGYRLRERSSYLAVNEFSDRNKEELDRMRNKRPTRSSSAWAAEGGGKVIRIESLEEAERMGLKPDKDREDESERLVEGNKRSIRRAKREIGKRPRETGLKLEPRNLPVEKLIQSGQQEPESVATLAKLDRQPVNNNPDFDPLDNVPMSRGLVKHDVKPIDWAFLAEDMSKRLPQWAKLSRDTRTRLLRVVETFKSIETRAESRGKSKEVAARGDQSELPDEMFVDLSQSGCMFKPRNQGFCGSCYIFAGMALIEYLYCKHTDRLVAFSEQYLVDCGVGLIPDMDACESGVGESPADFVHNFGLLLRDKYPYIGRANRCPFTPGTDISKTGFIRMDIEHILAVPPSAWPKIVQTTPIYVGINTGDEFIKYGGGVHKVEQWDEFGAHAMAVVGHGREDGREFWLMRNSFGTNWGESGYYKLDKQSKEGWLLDGYGLIYGTGDGINYKVQSRLNKNYSGAS